MTDPWSDGFDAAMAGKGVKSPFTLPWLKGFHAGMQYKFAIGRRNPEPRDTEIADLKAYLETMG